MTTFHHSFTIQSDRRPTFEDVTLHAQDAAGKSGFDNGLMTVYSQHTTCSVLIQEQSDDVNYWGEQFILQDMMDGLSKIFPTCTTDGQYLHPGPEHIRIAQTERGENAWESLNTDAHLRSVLLGRSVTVPLIDGELQLGQFGRIYFADMDQVRARQRTVRIAIVS
ncbi:secondary thiamine-phosphate synthase enzyme YjbQ [Mycolicibacterium komossense]|uniref:YjbQ family protein n=1 Tax=Mycolicibacterium komossense TaxID=1779 RepID=A0ABT3C6N3_9MYCO|nr:secondary thiamine-phosphate synthase enzyme YjbQ [Mycolicibacterium komossense]MCV7225134.1 YjbQ family protein [Mycolicibacterium komossense]